MPKERVAIGMVADAVTWWHAATLVQQLKNLKTKLQIVVFYLRKGLGLVFDEYCWIDPRCQ